MSLSIWNEICIIYFLLIDSLSYTYSLLCVTTGCLIFVYGCVFTIKNHPGKALFYLPFTLFFSVWFLLEPTYRLLSFYIYPVLKRYLILLWFSPLHNNNLYTSINASIKTQKGVNSLCKYTSYPLWVHVNRENYKVDYVEKTLIFSSQH